MPSKSSKKTDKTEVSYLVLRSQLDALLAKLQDPDCDVDEAVGLYEQAMALTVKLEAHLETAENTIKKVKADFGV